MAAVVREVAVHFPQTLGNCKAKQPLEPQLLDAVLDLEHLPQGFIERLHCVILDVIEPFEELLAQSLAQLEVFIAPVLADLSKRLSIMSFPQSSIIKLLFQYADLVILREIVRSFPCKSRNLERIFARPDPRPCMLLQMRHQLDDRREFSAESFAAHWHPLLPGLYEWRLPSQVEVY